MAETRLPKATWHDGRYITNATKWWWQKTEINMDELSCVHDRTLNETCPKCDDKKEWDDDVQGTA